MGSFNTNAMEEESTEFVRFINDATSGTVILLATGLWGSYTSYHHINVIWTLFSFDLVVRHSALVSWYFSL